MLGCIPANGVRRIQAVREVTYLAYLRIHAPNGLVLLPVEQMPDNLFLHPLPVKRHFRLPSSAAGDRVAGDHTAIHSPTSRSLHPKIHPPDPCLDPQDPLTLYLWLPCRSYGIPDGMPPSPDAELLSQPSYGGVKLILGSGKREAGRVREAGSGTGPLSAIWASKKLA